MKELLLQESPTTDVSSQGFIRWTLDDSYAKIIEKPKYTGRVRGTGIGIVPGKSNGMPRISSSSSQEPLRFQQISQMQAQMRQMQEAHENEIAQMNERDKARDIEIAQMHQTIERLV
jgi:hypothetical protein